MFWNNNAYGVAPFLGYQVSLSVGWNPHVDITPPATGIDIFIIGLAPYVVSVVCLILVLVNRKWWKALLLVPVIDLVVNASLSFVLQGDFSYLYALSSISVLAVISLIVISIFVIVHVLFKDFFVVYRSLAH